MGHARSHRDHERAAEHGEVLYSAEPEQDLLRQDKLTAEVMAGGSALEALAGATAAVIAIIGLAGHLPAVMVGVATIAIGVALLAQSGAVAARWGHARHRLDPVRLDRNGVLGGIGTEGIGGLVGIALGILALAGVSPELVVPAAAIVYGCALLLGGVAVPEFGDLVPATVHRYRREERLQRIIEGSGGAMVLVGIAAIVLGILAVLRVGPMLALDLIAMLAIGATLIVSGGALTTRFGRHLV